MRYAFRKDGRRLVHRAGSLRCQCVYVVLIIRIFGYFDDGLRTFGAGNKRQGAVWNGIDEPARFLKFRQIRYERIRIHGIFYDGVGKAAAGEAPVRIAEKRSHMKRIIILVGKEADENKVFYPCFFSRDNNIFRFRHTDDAGMGNTGDINKYVRIGKSRYQRFRLQIVALYNIQAGSGVRTARRISSFGKWRNASLTTCVPNWPVAAVTVSFNSIRPFCVTNGSVLPTIRPRRRPLSGEVYPDAFRSGGRTPFLPLCPSAQ